MAAANAAETVRVIVRCRPMNQREMDLKCQTVISMDTQINQISLINIDQTNEPPKQFTFDAVYGEDSITENIYADSVFPLVESVLEGYNATVFAYGQTGCGKSFTMQGLNIPGSPQRGVSPRSFEHIFEASSVAAGTKYLIRASYLEIYNESIRDLLSKDVKAALDLKEYVDKGVQVANLTWHQCTSVADCERLMDKGNKNRATGATLMNKDSSRSHSIFTILTEMCRRSELDGKEHIRAGKLNLVDLAGSERQSKTHAEGERLREATRINLSLSALGNVISALVDGRSKHIPYRDSKLTRLLQDSLGGNTKTLMIAAISPAHDNYDETLSTLRYANRAKNIKNKPRINEDPRDAQMKLLQEEINRLKQELLNANQSLPPPTSSSSTLVSSQVDYDEEIEREKERLRAEFEREASELRRQCQAERLTKEELQRQYEELKGQYDYEIDSLNPSKIKKNSKKNSLIMNAEEKLQRLHELENKFIGGEEINNEERKKKRKKKLNDMREKQEQRKRFTKILDNNDDEMMMKVFDNVQEELHFTTKKLEQLFTENKRLKSDNDDLQHEFEIEREGYLNTIRIQEKQILLFRTMMDKMCTIMQRNCNYSNIDRIIEQARYDEEQNRYYIPDPVIEDIQLPRVGKSSSSGLTGRLTQSEYQSTSRTFNSPSETKTDYEYNYSIPSQTINGHQKQMSQMSTDELERRYGQTIDTSIVPTGKLRNKRQEQLLNENASLQNNKLRSLPMNNNNNNNNNNNSENDYMNRRLNPFDAPVRLSQKYGLSTDKQ